MIRFATGADAGRIREIEVDADSLLFERFRAVPWSSTDGQWRLDQPGFVLLAVEESGRAVGMAHLLEVDGSAHLEQLGVAREAQRRGHGRALVEAVKDEARRRGHDEVTLRCYIDVPWQAPFYATCGFTEVDATRPFHRHVEEVEHRLGLDDHGRRVLMCASLSD